MSHPVTAEPAKSDKTRRALNLAIRLMNRLTFPQKFALISILFVFPLALVMFLLQSEFSSRIEFSSKEMLGNRALRPLQAALEHAIQSRILTHDWKSDFPPLPSELTVKLVQIESDITEFQVLYRGASQELQTTTELGVLLANWQKLGKQLTSASPKARDELHLAVLRDIQRLIALVGDYSNLILDPDLDSYYLMDEILLKLPEGAELIGRLQMHTRRTLDRGPTLNPEDRTEFIRLSELIHTNLAATQRGLQVAFNNNPAKNLRLALNEALQNYEQAGELLLTSLDAEIVDGSGMISLADQDGRMVRFLSASSSLWRATSNQLDGLLRVRIDTVRKQRQSALIVSLIAVLLAAYLLIGFYVSLRHTIQRLSEVSVRMTGGEVAAAFQIDTRDELGQVAIAFNTVAARLHSEWVQARSESARAMASEAERERLIEKLEESATIANRSRAQLESVIQSMQDGVFVFDMSGNTVLVNDAAARNNGYSSVTDLRRNLTYFAEIYEVIDLIGTRLPVEQWPISRILRGETVNNLELRTRRKDIGREWINAFSGGPVFDENGRQVLAVVISRDISEHKQSEQALRFISIELAQLRGSAFYEAVVNRLSELLNCEFAFVCRREPLSPDELFVAAMVADGALQPTFTYPVAGTPCEHVSDRHSCIIPRAVQQRYPNDLFLVEKQIESYVGVPFIDSRGQQIGHIGVMSRRPLTKPEHVEAVAKLFAVAVVAEIERQVFERRFSDLFEMSPDAIVISSRDGVIVQANQRAAEMFGWTLSELVGQPVEVLLPASLRAGHPQLRQRYLESAMPRAMGIGRNDLLGLTKDGNEFPIDISLSPMQTPEGLLVAATVRDATERQKVLKELQSAAGELRAANALIEEERSHLAERVAERTAELTATNEELIQASRFKSEFLATMSHELRTPLNGVLGMNELLLKTPLTIKQREFVDASTTSGRALLSLVNDVLDLSKIEAGKLELDIRSCELETLASDVVTMFSHRAKQTGISLVSQLDPETCVTALCDETRLRQVLVNLIGNALKFTSKGSVILESKCVERDDRRIVVRWAVTDTGLGIPEDKVIRLFSPFSQVDRSTSRQFGGTGLGLSITKQLVELMGGTIGVTSRLGVGSTFWIEIPFEFVNAEMKTIQRRQALAGTRVLVVDGVGRDRRQIADCLVSWECPFQHVSTLREAVETVAQAERAGKPFAVVIVDSRVAVGDEIVHLENLARRPNLPVIGLGIDESHDLAAQLQQIGLRRVLKDPVRSAALFETLTSVMATSAASESSNQPAVADEPTTLFSAHILVAEDNHINQLFVRELLKHCGCTCDVANNGINALAALEKNHYDLVLMDCQMPDMDGFTATREIRHRELSGALIGRVPILALTANALKGDRELCLEAGMDDYLTKPLQPAQLRAMLSKFLRTQPSSTVS